MNAPTSLPRLLIVDDDPDTRANLSDLLSLDDYQVETAATAADALARSDWNSYSAILLDRRLPDASFEQLLPRLRRLAPDAALIVVTGSSDLPGAVAALREGATDYIVKPVDPPLLRASLGRAIEQVQLRRARDRSEALIRTLVDAAELVMVIARPDRSIVNFSPFAEKVSGYRLEEVLGQDVTQTFLPATDFQRLLDLNRLEPGTRSLRGIQAPLHRRDVEPAWLVWNLTYLPDFEGAPAILAVGHDITDLKRAQERALQAERLAAIGQMVAGLAHESRNALQRSQACLELIALKMSDKPEILDLIRRTQKAQDHLHFLYEDVRTYASNIKLDRSPLDLPSIWREAWANLETSWKNRDVQISEFIISHNVSCRVDPFRMQQVFRNIFENALAACADPTAIRIACEHAVLGIRPAFRITIRDNGPGLTSEQARKIFEPFFTTKTRGTGLGMPISRRIVEAHGGEMAVGTPSTTGAEIIILLPRDVESPS